MSLSRASRIVHNKWTVFTIPLILVGSGLFSPSRYTPVARSAKPSMSVTHQVEFKQSEFTLKRYRGYDFLTYPGGYYPSTLGTPMLPAKEIKLALPPGMRAETVRVLATDVVPLDGTFNFLPKQAAHRIGIDDSEVEFVGPDAQVYESDSPFPSGPAELVSQADLAGQSMAVIRIWPLRYHPKQGKLDLHRFITFVVEGSDGYECRDYLPPHVSEQVEWTYRRMVEAMVENKQDVALSVSSGRIRPSALPPVGPFDHVTITSSALAPLYQPLVDWNIRKGLRDTVVTTEYIAGNYSGQDYEKVRGFVTDAHLNWGVAYFLLAGENDVVPFVSRTYAHGPVIGDMYYSDFDDDWVCEVYVGRISAENAYDQIGISVNKVLTYQTNPPVSNYPLDICLVGMDLAIPPDPLTRGEELKEYIDTVCIPDRFNVTRIYDSDPDPHKQAFMNAINDGQNLVNHCDHTNYNLIGIGALNHDSALDYTDVVYNLANGDRTSVFFSMGCHLLQMDLAGTDCIGEHMLFSNDNGGAVAVVGNTRDGLYYPPDPMTLTGYIDYEWWGALFSSQNYLPGEILAWSKNLSPHSTDDWRYSLWSLNLLGAPAMPIWTDSIRNMVVSHDSLATLGPSLFSVHVESTEGAPIDSAYVCLWKGDEVYERGYTDADGDLSLWVDPTGRGEMLVTVTVKDRLPYLGSVDVAPFNTEWQAAWQVFPDVVCPVWELVDNSAGGPPAFEGDTLVITTSDNADDLFYRQDEPLLAHPDTLVIEFRMRYESGSTGAPERRSSCVGFHDASGFGNVLFIGQDEIFLLSDINTMGDSVHVDTDSDYHTYRIRASADGSITVSYDGVDTLMDSSFTYAGWSEAQSIFWGDAGDSASGVSRWTFFRHNAYAFDTDVDFDGVTDSCDNCVDDYDPAQADADGDGIGDVCDQCTDTDGDGYGNPGFSANTCLDDNCPYVANPDQSDADLDGVGDACEVTFAFDTIPNTGSAYPFVIKSIDLDYDNYSDIVFSGGVSNDLSLARGLIGGTFDPPLELISGTSQQLAVALGFVDADTPKDYPDIIAAAAANIYVWFDPGLTVTSPASFPYSGVSPTDIELGFIDDDNFLDIVVTPNHLFFGDGQGGFPTNSTTVTFKSVDVGDFNGDGYNDLLLGIDNVRAGSDYAVIYLNSGSGSFTYASDSIELGDVSWEIPLENIVVDVDRDRNLDFVFATPRVSLDSTFIYVAIGNGSGYITDVDTIAVDGLAMQLAASDFDRDKRLDIMAVNASQGVVHVFLRDEFDLWSVVVISDLNTDESTYPLAIADFDRDGNPDFISGESTGETGNLLIGKNDYPDLDVSRDQMIVTVGPEVLLEVVNPLGYIISQNFQTVAGASYWRHDVADSGFLMDETFDYNWLTGEYQISIFPQPNADSQNIQLGGGITIDGTQQRIIFSEYICFGGTTKGSNSVVFYFDEAVDAIINPKNGLPSGTPSPTFSWGDLMGTTSPYRFQLSYYHDFRDSIIRDVSDLNDASYALDTSLSVGSVLYWRVMAHGGGEWSDISRTFALYVSDFICGDIDNNGSPIIDIADLVYLVEWMFQGGPPPPVMQAADLDGSDNIDISDLVYLVEYMFQGGPAPHCGR